jgi:hypothetical protein
MTTRAAAIREGTAKRFAEQGELKNLIRQTISVPYS